MSGKTINTTKNCVSEVSFEFQKIPSELSRAKHTWIVRLFTEALVRHGQGTCEDKIGVRG